MIQSILKKVLGSKNDREIKKMRPLIDQIGTFEERLKKLADAELQAQTTKFREQLGNGASIDDLLPEAYATVREASRRVLHMRHYDVQLIGGIAMHRGTIAEMRTGEGKTLVATLPVYLNALPAKGVHVVTVNDYLASRDAEWMGRLYRWMGLSVGTIVSQMPEGNRKGAYDSDITYGQNNEFGFDYLRDNMKFSRDRMVQRPLNFAIVDEVDSILIDEARTPLIISGSPEKSSDNFYRVNDLIRPLKRDQDFIVDEKSHTVTLTEVGVDKLERKLKLDNLYAPDNAELLHHINQALKAHNMYKRDINYLVEDGKVVIIDEFTGRKMSGRRWSDGLHQAVEAKEGLRIQEETQTLATITFQNYFRQYEKLCGMTGTADTEAEEFASIYELDVLVIPTNRPIMRADDDDVVFTKERGKVRAIIDDIVDCHKRGQPVLVGTTSVDKSEFIAKQLEKEGVPHNVLNAKQHEREAHIIAQAGRYGAVTIATNMAGRGTDIVLGGNAEALVEEHSTPGMSEEEKAALVEQYRVQCLAERERVLEAGGLRIVGTERHESRRIDNQLRGRAGRQGDPGSSRFYLSLEDDLLRIFNAERIQRMMERFKVPDDEPIVHRWVTKAIENAQQKVEARNFDIRKNLLEYDDVMNQQRERVYALRGEVLDGDGDIRTLLFAAIDDVVEDMVHSYLGESAMSEDDFSPTELAEAMKNQFRVTVDLTGIPSEAKRLVEALSEQMHAAYTARESNIVNNLCTAARYEVEERWKVAVHQAEQKGEPPPGRPIVQEDKLLEAKTAEWQSYERTRYLQVVDQLWKDHLQEMSRLKEGIHLHAYAQKDPKLIYKQEAFELFSSLIGLIRRRVTEQVFLQEIKTESDLATDIAKRRKDLEAQIEKHRLAREAALAQQAAQSQAQASSQGNSDRARPQRVETIRREGPKVGRNDPCYCGSGKKYKKCHLPIDEDEFSSDDQARPAM